MYTILQARQPGIPDRLLPGSDQGRRLLGGYQAIPDSKIRIRHQADFRNNRERKEQMLEGWQITLLVVLVLILTIIYFEN